MHCHALCSYIYIGRRTVCVCLLQDVYVYTIIQYYSNRSDGVGDTIVAVVAIYVSAPAAPAAAAASSSGSKQWSTYW